MLSLDKYRKVVKRDGGFTTIPNILIGDTSLVVNGVELKSQHRLLLIALLRYDFRGGRFKVGQRALRAAATLGTQAVRVSTADLKAAGLLKVSSVANHPNEYDLTPFYDWFILRGVEPTPEEPAPTRSYVRSPDLDAALTQEK